MNSAPQVIVVGSFMQDLVFNSTEFPRPGETIIGQFVSGPGGKGSNQAVAATRAGSNVAYIGALGQDAFAGTARAFQETEGILWLATEKADCPTGAAGILVNSHGQNEIVVSLGANDLLCCDDIDRHANLIAGSKVLVAQLEANLEATAHALALAKAAGVIVVLNPAPMRPDFDPAVLTHVDILMPNETEFAALVKVLGLGDADLEALPYDQLHAICRNFGVPTLVVTLGSRGCFVSRADGFQFIPAIPGVRAIDTTGAGDCFVGAFVTALAEHGSGALERAARFANAAAAISVTRPGTAPAMPRRSEIDALLSSQGYRTLRESELLRTSPPGNRSWDGTEAIPPARPRRPPGARSS